MSRASRAAIVLLVTALARGPDAGAGGRAALLGDGARGRGACSELVPEFERAHPGRARARAADPLERGAREAADRLRRRLMPDVFQLGNTWIAEFVALGALEPLDARVATRGVPRDDVFPGIWRRQRRSTARRTACRGTSTRAALLPPRPARRGRRRARPPATWADWQRRAWSGVRAPRRRAHSAIFLPLNEWETPVILGAAGAAPRCCATATRAATSQSPAFRARLRVLPRPLPARARAGRDAATQVAERLPGVRARILRLLRHRAVEPGRVRAAACRRSCRTPGRRRRCRAARRASPACRSPAASSLAIVSARSRSASAAWRLVEFLSRARAAAARSTRLTGDLPARRAAWRDTALASDPRTMRVLRTQLERVRGDAQGPGVGAASRRAAAARGGARGPRDVRAVDAALAALDRDVDAHPREAALAAARAAEPRRSEAPSAAPGSAPWLFVGPGAGADRAVLLRAGGRRRCCCRFTDFDIYAIGRPRHACASSASRNYRAAARRRRSSGRRSRNTLVLRRWSAGRCRSPPRSARRCCVERAAGALEAASSAPCSSCRW